MTSPLLALDRPSAIAHAGGARLRPENTLAAFEHARALGVDAVECDVRLSRDGEVVVIHDETVDRTTNGTGPVTALTARELAQLDAAFHFGAAGGHPLRGTGVGVPRLADVLDRVAPLPVVVEIKGDRPEVVDPVIDVIRAASAETRVIIGGFHHAVMEAVRRRAPHIPTSASLPEVASAVRRAYFRLRPRASAYALFQVPIRHAGVRVVSRAFVRAARRAGRPVHVWCVDETAVMEELVALGATGLISDRPDRAVEVVARFRNL